MQITPGGDEHTARGWRQTRVADGLQEGEGETAAGRVAADDDVAGFNRPVRGFRRRLDEEEVWRYYTVLIICDRARKCATART